MFKKIIKVSVFIFITIASIIYSYVTPEKIDQQEKQALSITLEGAFNKTGNYMIKEGMLMKDVIKDVGVKENANLEALPLNQKVVVEQSIYLPIKRKNTISLNKGSLEEFMTLDGIGEKMANRIIEYRNNSSFIWLEDLMNVSGFGEKRFERYRDYLVL